jgi:ribonuclease HI
MSKEKKIVMYEIEVDIPEELVEKIRRLALEWIKDDTQALLNYGCNRILREQIEKEKKQKK